MNKKVLVTLLLAAIFGKIYAGNCSNCGPCKTICPTEPCRAKATSMSFFSVRPEFQAGMPERTTLWQGNRLILRENGYDGGLQLVPFGGRSTRTTDLAAYFSPYGLPNMTVCESIQDGTCDIISDHFNIYTNACTGGAIPPGPVGADANRGTRFPADPASCFASSICFEPQRSVGGLGITYRQGFARRDDGRGFFFEVSFPIERVKTTMNLGETILNGGDGALSCISSGDLPCPIESALAPNGQYTSPVGSVCEAFQQPAWAFGRIESGDSCSRNDRTGVADVDLLIGYDILDTGHCYMRSYLGVLAPTGNKPNGVLLFEPIIGHNKHTALRYGGSFGAEVWHHHTKDRSMWFDFQSEFFFFLSNNQVRSFDVKNRPWSRYMQVYSSFTQALEANDLDSIYLHTPGINVFTQEVKVSPGTARTYQSALIFNNEGWQGELGYTFYARPAECVELTCAFPSGVAFKSLSQPGFINNVQTISNTYGDNNAIEITIDSADTYLANNINANDLDMNSAAHPAMMTYIVYASMGNRWDDREYPFFLGGGGSYEFSKDNTGMTRWLLWAKAGFSF